VTENEEAGKTARGKSAHPRAVGLRTHYCGSLSSADIGTTVTVTGWVAHRREHGGHLGFLDIRDHTGIVQCVVEGAGELRSEYVVKVRGTVRPRPTGTENPGLATGEVELGECVVEVLATADPPPFPLDGRQETDEAVRLRYRYVDLRSERMQANLRLRGRVCSAIRRALEADGFLEVETPLLWTPTPEGAREFAIPSRLQPGSFYVLPQSPQIAKQLLMVGGIDRYFQIAKCMRDEDLRADRQFEFTQVDLEASFVEKEDVFCFVNAAVTAATEAVTGEAPAAPATMTFAEAIDRFGTDKPDLRFGSELCDLSPVLHETECRAFLQPCVKAIRIPRGATTSRSGLDSLVERARSLGAAGLVWCRVVTDEVGGADLDSPVTRFLTEKERQAMIEVTGSSVSDLLLVVAGAYDVVSKVLGQLRLDCCQPPVFDGPHRYAWVTDFPLFEGVDDSGAPISAHHPFTMPHPEDIDRLEADPLSVRSQSYDLVLNGWELGSGSIRIHRADIQRRVFSVLGISEEVAEARFGFLLGAFRYGAPPHGGFAFGLDRLVAILSGEENIREVIAFPKTQSGADLMSGSPRPVSPEVLQELRIALLPPRHGA
jgi:aspartyl-tRNA synthetase